MIATYVPDLLTPFGFEEAAAAMRYALMLQLTRDPDEATLALALAKTALETARWQKIHRSNFGNIKAGESYAGMYTAFRCGEELETGSWLFSPDGWEECVAGPKKGVRRRPVVYSGPPLDDWHPQTRFRAYANHYDGAVEYVKFVAGGRYAGPWAALLDGNAEEFVHRLKLARYFTADEKPYLKGVLGLRDEFVRRLQGLPAEEHEPDRSVFEHAERMLALWFDEQRHPENDHAARSA